MRGRSSPNSTHSLLPVHARSTITSYNTRGHTALSGLAATHVESIRVRRRGVTSKSPWHSWTERGRLPRRVHDGKRACPRAEGMQASPEGWYKYSTISGRHQGRQPVIVSYVKGRSGSVPSDIIVGWGRREDFVNSLSVEFGPAE